MDVASPSGVATASAAADASTASRVYSTTDRGCVHARRSGCDTVRAKNAMLAIGSASVCSVTPCTRPSTPIASRYRLGCCWHARRRVQVAPSKSDRNERRASCSPLCNSKRCSGVYRRAPKSRRPRYSTRLSSTPHTMRSEPSAARPANVTDVTAHTSPLTGENTNAGLPDCPVKRARQSCPHAEARATRVRALAQWRARASPTAARCHRWTPVQVARPGRVVARNNGLATLSQRRTAGCMGTTRLRRERKARHVHASGDERDARRQRLRSGGSRV